MLNSNHVQQAVPPFNGDGSINAGPVCFVCSYVVIVNWTLLQICVAVLLDTFVSTRQMHENERMEEKMKDLVARGTIRCALDPLLECLTKEYTDDADLSQRLHEIFQV